MGAPFNNIPQIPNQLPSCRYGICLSDISSRLKKLVTTQKEGHWITPQILAFDPQQARGVLTAWLHSQTTQAQFISFSSITDAAKQLQALSPGLWYHLSYTHHRRGELILHQLPRLRLKKRNWSSSFPKGPLSLFSLLDHHLLIALVHVYPALPPEPIPFITHPAPPSRAYLKLYEAFYRLQAWPQKAERLLELGSSPGGWTWVLANEIHCQVDCVDQGQMDEKLLKNPLVKWYKKDAFSYAKHLDWSQYHWLFSDMACSPHRLRELLEEALSNNPQLGVVATLKLQDRLNDLDRIFFQFEQLKPQGQLVHLTHNKHELTWLKPPG